MTGHDARRRGHRQGAAKAYGCADPYFDNIEIAEGDLQVGDHLVFYNSFVYQDVAIGEWQLENSIVMDIDSDYTTSSIQRGQIHLQGHGTCREQVFDVPKRDRGSTQRHPGVDSTEDRKDVGERWPV